MGYRIIIAVFFAVFVGVPRPSSALHLDLSVFDSRTSLAGDVDGLGLGLVPSQAFNFADIPTFRPSEAAEGVFDTWIGGPNMPEVSWTQTGFEGVDILDAFCVIGSGGWGGINGPPILQIEGQVVGSFQTAEIENSYLLNVFDLTPFVEYLRRPLVTLSFVTPYTTVSSNSSRPGWFDSGALDFSEIRVTFQNSQPSPSPVPEPDTLILFVTCLLVLTWITRLKHH